MGELDHYLHKCCQIPQCTYPCPLGLVTSGVLYLNLACASESRAISGASDAANLFKKDLKKSRRKKIPIEDYTDVPVEGGGPPIKIYEVKPGGGLEAEMGSRVAVHYELRWRSITFQTSRQGMGVTGGSPLGFNIGAKPGAGGTLKGLDLAVRGMRVGGQRKALIPPEYGYGDKASAREKERELVFIEKGQDKVVSVP